MAIGTYITIITLNINGLNTPTKRHRLAEWIQKQKQLYYPLVTKWLSKLWNTNMVKFYAIIKNSLQRIFKGMREIFMIS